MGSAAPEASFTLFGSKQHTLLVSSPLLPQFSRSWMRSAIDQILRKQDTMMNVRHRDNFNWACCPLFNAKETDGSKRQFLSVIGPTPIYVSEHSHGTYPSDSTTSYLWPDQPTTGAWLPVDSETSVSKSALHASLVFPSLQNTQALMLLGGPTWRDRSALPGRRARVTAEARPPWLAACCERPGWTGLAWMHEWLGYALRIEVTWCLYYAFLPPPLSPSPSPSLSLSLPPSLSLSLSISTLSHSL